MPDTDTGIGRHDDSAEAVGRLYDAFGQQCAERGTGTDDDTGAGNFGFGDQLHFGYWDSPQEELGLAEASLRLTDMVIERLAVDPGSRVLDLGCGIGGPALRLHARTGAAVEGVTLSRDQVDDARRAAEIAGADHAVRFRVADARRTPFEDASFDAVVALESIMHVPDRSEVVAEAARVLRPGGRLVLTDFFERGPILPEQRPALQMLLEGSMMSLSRAGDYPDLLRAAGMTFEEIRDISRHSTRRTFLEMARVQQRAAAESGGAADWPDPCAEMVAVDGFGYLLLTARRVDA